MAGDFVWHSSGAGIFDRLPAGYASGFSTRRMARPDDVLGGLSDALGDVDADRVRLRQVHGREFVVVDDLPEPRRERRLGPADAAVTSRDGRMLVIETADCVPVILIEPAIGVIAAIHAGWRGASLHIVDAVLDDLFARGGRPELSLALFGPSISRDRYEVGPEVVETLERSIGGSCPEPDALSQGEGDRSFVDVAAIVRTQLLKRGLIAENFRSTGLCTASSPELFPSYRREGTGTGRILTAVTKLPQGSELQRA